MTVSRPVISVGNLAMGGRGKTPVVAEVARLLVAAGERPAILSRGYGRERREDGVVIVSDGRHQRADVARSGDEPRMLATLVPRAAVLVGEIRAEAAVIAERNLDATVHILDDGFQHRSIERNVDIVLVAPDDLAGRPLPFGRLRSPVSSLRRAHAVIVDGTEVGGVLEKVRRHIDPTRTAIFRLDRRIGSPQPLEPSRPWPDTRGPVVALCGIARPARFQRALEAAGWMVTRLIAMRDHHAYTHSDLARVARAVHDTQATAVVTTTKDAVRLLPLRPFPVPVAAIPLDISIEPQGAFEAWLIRSLREVA
jgi:tetraacyldisaccharide 4'-kinase